MTQNSIEFRRQKYFNLSSRIAQLDRTQLHYLFDNSESNESSTGWGNSHVLDFGQSKIFVKRIPVTNLEYDNLFSTSNLYDLPTFCNYGIGPIASTGSGIFRELVTHIKTTQWILDGAIATFPLMYHYRIMPLSGQRFSRGEASLREASPTPTPTGIDLDRHKEYVTDFGLVLDKSFALTKEEEAFFEQNIFYDYGEVLRNLRHLMRSSYDECSEIDKRRIVEKYDIKPDLKPHELVSILLDNIEVIQVDGDMQLDEFYVASIVKYRSIITLMHEFFAQMWGDRQKNTKLPHVELQRLLKETGFLPSAEVHGS